MLSNSSKTFISCSFFLTGILFWLFFSLPLPVSAVDFSTVAAGRPLVYRFIPSTGTLNDLTVIYQGHLSFQPSFFGGITRFELAGHELHPWEGKHTSVLLEEEHSGGIYRATFRWSYSGDSFDFSMKIWVHGPVLFVRFLTDSGNQNVTEFGTDRSEQTPDPKVLEVPYGHNILYSGGVFLSAVLDPFQSNASTMAPLKDYHSITSAGYGYEAFYHPLTDGSRNSLSEIIQIAVSADIGDVFFQPRNPVSPFRYYLTNKVIVDLWREKFEYCRDDLQRLTDMGMTDLMAIVHVWQKYGYDNGLPTSYPAGELYGGESGVLEISQLCSSQDYLFALHTNYVDFYENSDVWNGDDVALDSDGARIKAWYNQSTGMQSYLLKPSRAVYYANLYEPLIHDTYRTTAGFLDVHSSVLPSNKVDYDARIPDAGKQVFTFEYYHDLITRVRDIHGGPVLGEGFGPAAMIWAGYVDGVEADPRSEHGRGGTDVPLIVDFKLNMLHPLFVPHGAGYLERFYLDKWSGYSAGELERYRVTQMAFGNAGFIHNPFVKNITEEQIMLDYCLLKHVQQYYLKEVPLEIYYGVVDQLLTLSAALKNVLPSLPGENLSLKLNEEISRLKLVYADGFTLYINRSLSENWKVEEQSVAYTLPPNGFLAQKGGEFLAYLALVNGEKTYYMFPKEPVCCRIIDPAVNFAGEKILNAALLQNEYINVLNWQTFPENKSINKCLIFLVNDTGWELLVELDSENHEYRHRNVMKDKSYTYALVAVDKNGMKSEPVVIRIE